MVAIAALLAVSCAVAPPPPPHVGLSDFQAPEKLKPLAGAVSGLVANELQRMGAFKVTTPSQVREMLSLDRQQQLLGCSDDSCLSGVALDLGFDYLITGTLSSLASARGPSRLSLELVLLDRQTRARAGSEVIDAADEAELMAHVASSVAKLVSGLLKARSGSLVVRSTETGSVLKVDEVVVGTTPLQGRLALAAGPHYLKLEKDGFVSWQKEVRIVPDELTEESARLVPSPDFIAAYESKQTKLRVGASAATGLAAASVVTAIAFETRSASLYGSKDGAGSFLELRQRVAAGDDSAREPMEAVKAQINTSQTITGVFIGIAVAGAVGAGALWLLGDDPGRYGAYRDVGLKAGLAPLPGGGFASLMGQW